MLNVWIIQFQKKLGKIMMVGVDALLWTIWRLRNKLIFDAVRVTDPSVPVKMLANWLSDWSILQRNKE